MWVGVGLATFGASFISGPPHLSWGRAELITVIWHLSLHYILFTRKKQQKLRTQWEFQLHHSLL